MKKLMVTALALASLYTSQTFANDALTAAAEDTYAALEDGDGQITIERDISVTGVDSCREHEIMLSADAFWREREAASNGRLLFLSCNIVPGTFARKHDKSWDGKSSCRASAKVSCSLLKF